MKKRSREKYSSQAACRKVLVFLHENELKKGDRLPSHAELVRRLHVCHDTLNTAMKWLVAEGILSRKQRLGTVVENPYPQCPKRTFWQVGIVAPPITSSYFISVLIHYLHRHLGMMGFADRVYMLSVNAIPSSEVIERHPEDFSSLAEDLETEVLNALITSARLVTEKVPVCGVCSIQAHFGVTIDHRLFALDAVKELRKVGYRRILAAISHPQESFGQLFTEGVNEAKAVYGLGKNLETTICSNGIENGYRLAREILERPFSEKVDAIILKDDITAQACASVLASEGRPIPMAVQTNLQIPLSFSVPAIRFALDIDGMAQKGVELLLQKLLRPSKVPSSQSLPVKLQPVDTCSSLIGLSPLSMS